MKRPRKRTTRAWVGILSRAHVRRAVAGSFAQLGHGKRAPLERMMVGDWLVYYSPKTDFPDGAPLRAFTALGRVVGERAYTDDMGGGFVPYRRNVAYVKPAREVSSGTLLSKLDFVARHPNWGMLARRGHFEITMTDLRRIAKAMGASTPDLDALIIIRRPESDRGAGTDRSTTIAPERSRTCGASPS